jgi:tellurite resistance protein TerC
VPAGATPSSAFDVPLWAWLFFGAVLAVSLVIDLVMHRGDREPSRKEALGWSLAWIAVGLLFAIFVGIELGPAHAQDYVTAYLVEKSLSIDNLFVFLVIFHHLKIPHAQQHRVLFWGIIGALITRALFIAAGAALLTRWHWVVYLLGALLIYTGLRTAAAREEKEGEKEGRIIAFFRRHLPATPRLHGNKFFAVEFGRKRATPLFLALITIELTDVMFAVDSIPAVFAVTGEPFIVFSSNVFAVLGLRALYLVLTDVLRGLRHLRYGLSAILLMAGVKMILADEIHVSSAVSLGAVLFVVACTVVASIVAKRRDERHARGTTRARARIWVDTRRQACPSGRPRRRRRSPPSAGRGRGRSRGGWWRSRRSRSCSATHRRGTSSPCIGSTRTDRAGRRTRRCPARAFR